MRRAVYLQEVKKMRFEQSYADWRSGRLTQEEAAQILGVSERSFRRYVRSYDEGGLDVLADRRLNQPSRRKAPEAEELELANLYRREFLGFNVRHFHEKYQERQVDKPTRSYTWVKSVLQGHGLIKRAKARGKHRIKRERKPMRGMMIHQDASTHWWVKDQPWDLVVTMDDATNEHYDMRFVPQEGTASSLAGVKAVIREHGIPSSLYTDRGAHYWTTPKAGGKVDKRNLTQFGLAMQRLSIEMIAAYSPQARGRSERAFRTHQGRLPQELAAAKITTMEAANAYLRQVYMPHFNGQFATPAAQTESAFVAVDGLDIDDILSEQYERTVGNDNCVTFGKLSLQIPQTQHRHHFVRCKVKVRVSCEGQLSLHHGPRCLARYDRYGTPLTVGAP